MNLCTRYTESCKSSYEEQKLDPSVSEIHDSITNYAEGENEIQLEALILDHGS